MKKEENEKENGAHKHLSHLKKLRVQNIHVMLFSALIIKPKQSINNNRVLEKALY